ncbi:MAG: hypothetical protein ACYDAC_07760 [Candidatus Dormibacteria bacterium]
MLRWAGAVAASALLAACGQGAAAERAPAPPVTQLLTVDQLVAPDFSADVPAHAITAAAVTALDGTGAALLQGNGWRGAAQVDFFRQDSNLAQLDGPVEIQDTAVAFASAAGAHAVFAGDAVHLDSVPGSIAVSTGALGDEAHATQRVVTVAGVDAVEFTVEWRVGSLVDILVVRGRWGGTRLADALLLAHTQTSTEGG